MSFIVKRDAWHELIEQLGEPVAKTLPSSFNGREVKEGLRYYRYLTGSHVYFYQVTDEATGKIHYEIFKRLITGKRKYKRELFPWEEPVYSTIETFTKSGAANFRFSEILRESHS